MVRRLEESEIPVRSPVAMRVLLVLAGSHGACMWTVQYEDLMASRR